jgi:hypothetical protein
MDIADLKNSNCETAFGKYLDGFLPDNKKLTLDSY